MFSEEQRRLAETILASCREDCLRLATAESCTGGLISACLTSVPGSSDVFERGFVTYTNSAKMELLGVPADLITQYGAVSEEVAREMVEGALLRAPVEVAVAVTGIAGPSGGTATKPVGRVHIAAARVDHATRHARYQFEGDRDAIRDAALTAALQLLAKVFD